MPPRCFSCKRSFKSARSVKLHTSKSKDCRKLWTQELLSELPRNLPEDLDFILDPFPNYDQPPLEQPPLEVQSPDPQPEPPAKRLRVSIEEVEDEDSPGRYIEPYPEPVGGSVGRGEVPFETHRREQAEKGQSPCFPFKDEDEFQLAEWMMKSIGHNSIEELLKLNAVRCTAHIFFSSNDH
jgi:hypothetical protein